MKRISTLMSRSSKIDESQFKDKDVPIRILGSRGAGKTSFLYKSYFKYSTQEPDTPFDVIPTPSHNVEVIPFKSYQFEIWDFAELSTCLNYLQQEKVIIYMMDAEQYSNESVASKCRENMIWLLENFSKILENTIIVTVANKQDKESMDIQDIGQDWVKDKHLMSLLKGHEWRIFSCNSLDGQGIDRIFDYIALKLDQQNQPSSSSMSPSLSQSSTITENDITPWENLPNAYHFTDYEFKSWFQQGRIFIYFDTWCLIRIIYLILIQVNNEDNYKKKQQMVLWLHEHLQFILRKQKEQETVQQSITYSLTQTLFWIQMVSFSLLKLPLLLKEEDFQFFLLKSELNQDLWKNYYTQKLFYSEKAAQEFLPPDKKPLPNAFKPSSLALKGSGLRIDYEVL